MCIFTYDTAKDYWIVKGVRNKVSYTVEETVEKDGGKD